MAKQRVIGKIRHGGQSHTAERHGAIRKAKGLSPEVPADAVQRIDFKKRSSKRNVTA